MEQKNLDKLKQLEQIADDDPICADYARTAAELETGFRRLLRLLPGKSARKIEAYMEYRRLHAQRMLWLACEHMDFKEE